MVRAARGFVPVVHGATADRADEVDTLVAARAVAEALERLGYAAEMVGLGLDFRPIEALAACRPLAVFNLVDAVRGDGRLAPLVPALLDRVNLPYTGARTSAWLATLSKIATKLALAAQGLPTPAWSEDGRGLDPATRVIVKPVFEHGSLGLDARAVVRGADAAQAVAARALRWKTEHFAEAYIEGREFNLALMDGDGGVAVLPIAEILFEGFGAQEPRIVGYDAKWSPKSAAYLGTPRRFGIEREEPALAAELTELARACWRCFGLTGYARVDFRVDERGAPTILEVNVNPCLSPDAGFAAAAAEAGLSYDAMVARILEAARGDLRASA
jgi:D-alanine-D-alanine ligase